MSGLLNARRLVDGHGSDEISRKRRWGVGLGRKRGAALVARSHTTEWLPSRRLVCDRLGGWAAVMGWNILGEVLLCVCVCERVLNQRVRSPTALNLHAFFINCPPPSPHYDPSVIFKLPIQKVRTCLSSAARYMSGSTKAGSTCRVISSHAACPPPRIIKHTGVYHPHLQFHGSQTSWAIGKWSRPGSTVLLFARSQHRQWAGFDPPLHWLKCLASFCACEKLPTEPLTPAKLHEAKRLKRGRAWWRLLSLRQKLTKHLEGNRRRVTPDQLFHSRLKKKKTKPTGWAQLHTRHKHLIQHTLAGLYQVLC